MKTVIMAGGEGKRLKPITCTVPKPLAKLCGKPIIEYILDLLKKHEMTDCVVSVGYKADKIISHFDSGDYKNIELKFVKEDKPLGTAGGVKNAVENTDEDILVISGDAMCDFDLTSAVKFHKQKNADATIIVKHVSDPREYGLVLCSENGDVKSFLEKPSYESCISDMANTGVYILSKKVLDMIADDTFTDFAQDVFPEMLKSNMKICAYEESGYWCDIGDIKSYLKCQNDMLSGLVNCEISGHKTLDGVITATVSDFKGAKISAPSFIGKNVRIAPGAIIDSYSVICDDATVEKGAKVHGSVIMNGAFLGERTTCNEAIICDNARILNGASVFELGVVGEKAVIGEECIIESGVKIWSEKQLEANTTASFDIKYGTAKPIYIEDDGVSGETGGQISPQLCASLGAGIATVTLDDGEGFPIAVGYRGTHSSKALALSVISGALASGADVWNLGECIETELIFSMSQSNIKFGCFVESGIVTKIKFFGENGLPLTRKQERKIELAVNNSDYSRAGFSEFGKIQDIYSVKELYANHIRQQIGTKLHGFNVSVNSANKRVTEICSKILSTVNDKDGDHIIFHISSDGKKLSAYSDETGYVFYEKLILLGCRFAFEKGEEVALPYSAPKMADNIAKAYGKTIKRYYHCPADDSDKEARSLAADSVFPRDSIMLMSLILRSLSESRSTLKKAVSELPHFTAVSRFVPISKSPSEILKCVCTEKCGLSEGVVASDDDGRVLIRPVKTGKGVMMFVESFKAETASELCDIYEKMLEENSR